MKSFGVMTPPVAITLIAFAPFFKAVRTAFRISSGESTTYAAFGISPWPPVIEKNLPDGIISGTWVNWPWSRIAFSAISISQLLPHSRMYVTPDFNKSCRCSTAPTVEATTPLLVPPSPVVVSSVMCVWTLVNPGVTYWPPRSTISVADGAWPVPVCATLPSSSTANQASWTTFSEVPVNKEQWVKTVDMILPPFFSAYWLMH